MDPQKIEASNLNRLVGATQHDVDNGLAEGENRAPHNPGHSAWALVEAAQANWQDVDHLTKDAHVLLGCVDG